MQVEWEHAAKDAEKTLSAKAAGIREKTRRALLAEFAPIMVQNDWAAADHSTDARPVDTRVLPGMNPATARGILEARADGLPHDVVLTFVWDTGRLRATAKLTEPDSP